MKRNFILWLLIINSHYLLSQVNTIDSLQQILTREPPDTTRILTLAELSQLNVYSRPDSAFAFAQEGLNLAISTSFLRGEVICLNKLSNVFRVKGNLPRSLDINLQALKKAESIHDEKSVCRILSDIGVIYFIQGDYPKSVEYYLNSKRIAEQIRDNDRLMISYINLGDAYMRMNLLDSALIFTNQAYELSLKIQNDIIRATSLNNLGNIYSRLKNPLKALEFYKTSLSYYIAQADDDGVCESTIGIARLFRHSGQYDSSLYYAKLSMEAGQQAGFPQRILEAGSFLADFYKEQGNVDSAYVYLQTTMFAKDQYFSQEKIKQMENLSFDESMRQKEIATAKAIEEKERKDNIQYAIIAIGLICFMILVILLSNKIRFHEKWIRFLGVLGLLLVFEFINLYAHPFLGTITHHSPVLMLTILVLIAAILIPLHHRLEHWLVNLLIIKNKKLKPVASKGF